MSMMLPTHRSHCCTILWRGFGCAEASRASKRDDRGHQEVDAFIHAWISWWTGLLLDHSILHTFGTDVLEHIQMLLSSTHPLQSLLDPRSLRMKRNISIGFSQGDVRLCPRVS